MSFLSEQCEMRILCEETISNCSDFDCDNTDLNEFFKNDSPNFSKELLGKTYCFVLTSDKKTIISAITLSNDSIKIKPLKSAGGAATNALKRSIPNDKRFGNYPAVLIGRLGTTKQFSGKGIGSELIDYIKIWFTDTGNKTGCRFIVVDSYNNERTLKFYTKNGFKHLFPDEKDERSYLGLEDGEELKTRYMYFDLIKVI